MYTVRNRLASALYVVDGTIDELSDHLGRRWRASMVLLGVILATSGALFLAPASSAKAVLAVLVALVLAVVARQITAAHRESEMRRLRVVRGRLISMTRVLDVDLAQLGFASV